MHWLQTLDTNLFLFLNLKLVNPFFDWLMPVLSGGNGVKTPFLIAAIVIGLGLLLFGNRRARLCVMFTLLIVGTNDALLCAPLKQTIGRTRPFVTLPQARQFGVVGQGYLPPDINAAGVDMVALKGSHNSMPSSHAANMFAATMALFLFYRRSLWFMLPFALAVSFSRIYNGVHYPSDVLAGALIGAGWAVAVAVAIEMAWQCLGKRFFPRAHAQAPTLVPNLNLGNRPAR
jgi:undecaprenyl-diphosphatase